MKPEHFYPAIQAALESEPAVRHLRFSTLHAEVLVEYTGAVRGIDTSTAARVSSDGRTLQQVVGHIMEWDRYMIQAAGEMLSGVANPQMMSLQGYHLPDNSTQDFDSIDDFNARQAEKQLKQTWPEIQMQVLDYSEVLYTLFSTPGLLDATHLEATAPTTISLPGGVKLASTVGWQLWMVVIEHEGVEHADDLF